MRSSFDPELQTRILDYVVEKNYCLMSGYNGKWVTSNLSRFPGNGIQ